MSYKIISLSNSVVDMCFGSITFPVLPGEHQFVGERLITPGGMANTMLCAVRLGMQGKSLGFIGEDDLADVWRGPMIAEGIDVEDVISVAGQPTPIAIALSDVTGEHLFIGGRSNMKVETGQFPEKWRRAIRASEGLIIYGWSYSIMGPEGNLEAIKAAKSASNSAEIPIFFDPGPEIPDMDPDWLETMLKNSTVVMLTYDEAEMIVKEPLPPAEMAERIGQMGPELVVLKLGADGIFGRTATESHYQPGHPVKVVDMTAAGDTVIASVVYSYFEKHTLPRLVSLANAAGAACVKKFGAGTNVPYKHEIEAVLQEAKSEYTY